MKVTKAEIRDWGIKGLQLAIEQLEANGIPPSEEVVRLLKSIQERPKGVFQEEAYTAPVWWKFICPDCGYDASKVGHAIIDGAEDVANRHRRICPAKKHTT